MDSTQNFLAEKANPNTFMNAFYSEIKKNASISIINIC